jgi:zinc transport system permease protein
MQSLLDAIQQLMILIRDALGTDLFIVEATVAIVLVSLICGSIGALVVGNRMAFFSDALAHCAFAGVALGIIVAILSGVGKDDDKLDWILKLVMIVSGVLFGVGIAYVREKTTLASDTVIGVFFAAALGLGAVLLPALKIISNKNAEQFLFGSVLNVSELDLLLLMVLAVVMGIALVLRYNQLVFASFNASLARSRQIPMRLHNYLFIILLAVIVNVCIQAVGILLINAMLIVPAATAINLSRNLRQMFWWTIGISLAAGFGGMELSSNPHTRFILRGTPVQTGTGGWIVLLCVAAFGVSMVIGPWVSRRRVAPASLAG